MAGKKSSGRGPATVHQLNHVLMQVENELNVDLHQKLVQAIAAYHESVIGTPHTLTVEKRLWLAERTNPIWWVAATFLWMRDLARHGYYASLLWLADRWPDTFERFLPKPPEPCNHPIEALAQDYDEPSVPCPKCGMLLAVHVD